jgi:hypothetical protein
MADYLIKRNPEYTRFGIIKKYNNKNKVYSESIITSTKKNPLPENFKGGDTLWIAESNWGIYASGQVVKINNLEIFNTVDELIKYLQVEKNKIALFGWIKLSVFLIN